MSKTKTDVTWTDASCPVARTLDLVGDRWSLLIIRDAMAGAQSFGDFQRATGIARNILTDRLRRLQDRGIIERVAAQSGKRQIYALTDAGYDLFEVVVALRQWGENHAYASGEHHSRLVDRAGNEIATMRAVDVSGAPVDARSTDVLSAQPSVESGADAKS